MVLAAELAGIEACRVGVPWNASHKATMEVISRGLIDLGVLDCTFEEAMGEKLDGKTRQFFMHGTSHSLGMDVLVLLDPEARVMEGYSRQAWS